MSAIIINFDDQKLTRSYDSIGKAIIDYITDMDLSWEIEMAKRIYFGDYIEQFERSKFKANYKPFIQWLIFSYKINNNSSLIECLNDTYLSRLSKYERDALVCLKNTSEGLYKICSIEGEKVLVMDTFSKNKIYVWDSMLAKNAKKYYGLFMRTISLNDKNMALPGYALLSNSFLKDTIHYVSERFERYQHFNSNSTIKSFLSSNSLMLHRYFLRFIYKN